MTIFNNNIYTLTTILIESEFIKIIFNVCYCHLKFEKEHIRNYFYSNDLLS